MNQYIRPGCKDIWNSFMVDGAIFCSYDIPFCPTTATHIPVHQVTWEEAKQIHRKHIARKDYDYFEDAFVNWYIDDYKLPNREAKLLPKSKNEPQPDLNILNIILIAGSPSAEKKAFDSFGYRNKCVFLTINKQHETGQILNGKQY